MSWRVHPIVPDEVDEELPWTMFGSTPAAADTGVSLEAADPEQPWLQGYDVGRPTSPSSVPRGGQSFSGTSAYNTWPTWGGSEPSSPHSSTAPSLHAPYTPSPSPARGIVSHDAARGAYFKLLVSPRHTMDLVSNGAEALRSGYNATTETAGSIWGALTSKTAQRTALTSVLLGLVSTFLLGCAAVSYLAFYHEYLPDQVTTLPVHLQYGYEANPFGLVTLADKKFGDYQDYDISVTLNLPNSPINLERGNFMLALHLLDDQPGDGSRAMSPMTNPVRVLEGRNILYTSTRPAIVPYTDPLVSLASRLLFLAYHVFVPASETTRLVVPMVERLEFRPPAMMPTALVLDVQAGQSLQVYSASVTITAQLHGLRWFMHTWWITSFLLFTVLFWFWEVFSLGITILVLRLVFGGHGEGPRVKQEQEGPARQKIKREGESSGKTLDDVPMTFPISLQQPPLRYDPELAHTNDVTASTPQADMPPAAGVEADDEYEDAGVEEFGEEEGRDSGIGTSFSERDGPGALRRRVSGRPSDS